MLNKISHEFNCFIFNQPHHPNKYLHMLTFSIMHLQKRMSFATLWILGFSIWRREWKSNGIGQTWSWHFTIRWWTESLGLMWGLWCHVLMLLLYLVAKEWIPNPWKKMEYYLFISYTKPPQLILERLKKVFMRLIITSDFNLVLVSTWRVKSLQLVGSLSYKPDEWFFHPPLNSETAVPPIHALTSFSEKKASFEFAGGSTCHALVYPHSVVTNGKSLPQWAKTKTKISKWLETMSALKL